MVWLDEAAASEITSFPSGLAVDQDVVGAALTGPRSNGERQINRLKTLKRQMHGQANFELLKARLVAAS